MSRRYTLLLRTHLRSTLAVTILCSCHSCTKMQGILFCILLFHSLRTSKRLQTQLNFTAGTKGPAGGNGVERIAVSRSGAAAGGEHRGCNRGQIGRYSPCDSHDGPVPPRPGCSRTAAAESHRSARRDWMHVWPSKGIKRRGGGDGGDLLRTELFRILLTEKCCTEIA